MISPRMDIPVI